MKSVLMFHEGSNFERELLLPWLASFSEVVGVVIVENKNKRKFKRLKAEYRRSGLVGTLDSIAFKFYDASRKTDRKKKIHQLISENKLQYTSDPDPVELCVETPNSEATKRFLKKQEADIAIARVKLLLDEEIFSIPTTGTFAIHPGVCPEYRNAHGCFWAIAEDDHDNVGYTLLKIDKGVDTGPIYAQGGIDFDPTEDHAYIQLKVIADNLDEIRAGIEGAYEGSRKPLDMSGRKSEVWGQPQLTNHLHLLRREHKRKETAKRTMCLLYHDIVPQEESDESGLHGSSVWRYKLTPSRFENHLERIAKQSAPSRRINECPPHEADNGIYLTFDDGGTSLYNYAAPNLEKYGMRGHFSIITNRVGKENFLNEKQIRELSRRGHHIMSHTASHQDLINSDRNVRYTELERSKSDIEDITGKECVALSIPNGRYNKAVLQAAWDAGYEFIFTSDPVANPETEILGRWNIWNSTTAEELEAILHQDLIKTKKIHFRWNLLKYIKYMVGKNGFIRIRERVINNNKET